MTHDAAWALAEQAEDLLDLCHIDLARAYLGQGEALASVQPASVARLALARAHIELEDRQIDSAARAAATALAHAQVAQDTELELRSRMVELAVDLAAGRYAEAWALLEAALDWAAAQPAGPRLDFELWRCRSHGHLVLAQQQQALDAGERALEAARAWGNAKAEAAALGNLAGRWFALGYRLLADGEADAGRRALQRCIGLSPEALQLAVQARFPRLNLSNLNNLAGAYTALDMADEALSCFEQLYAMAARTGQLVTSVHARLNHARLLARHGRVDEALWRLQEGIGLAERLRVPAALQGLHLEASRLHEQRQEWQQALAAYKRFHDCNARSIDEQAAARAEVMAVKLRTREALAESQRLRQLAERLSGEALRDTLTGLPNRRGLEARLQALPMPLEGHRHFVALVDIDHFKSINDGHSHSMGDAVLKALGELLAQQMRGIDSAARWGGEEFVLMLQAESLDAARRACERLRQQVEAHGWAELAPQLKVTVSIGLAELAEPSDWSRSFALADERLYEAKRGGRNRTVPGLGDGPAPGSDQPERAGAER